MSEADDAQARAAVSGHSGWGMLAKTIEKSLVQKYMYLHGDSLDKSALTEAVQGSIADAQAPNAEAAFLQMAADAGNTAAAARLMPQKAATSGAAPPAGNLGGRGKALEDEYIRRAELELLKRLRAIAEQAPSATQSSSAQKAPDGSAMPQKSGASGAMPSGNLGGRGKALEDEYIRRTELELLQKMRAEFAKQQGCANPSDVSAAPAAADAKA